MKENLTFQRIKKYSKMSVSDFLKETKIPAFGLSKKQVEESKKNYGTNKIITKNSKTLKEIFFRSFITPFSVVLFILGLISLFTEILYPKNRASSFSTAIIIMSMLILSGIVRFFQEIQSRKITDKLINILKTKAEVYREGKWISVESEELAVGDFVQLNGGQRVPGDIRITEAENCFVSQSVINGESEIIEKNSNALTKIPEKITDFNNFVFQGSSVICGSCKGVILALGENSVYGNVSINNRDGKKGFDKGANSIAWVFIKFMIFLVPVVFVASGLTNGNWITAFLFALSVALGLTPELLPMVITACLGKGSYNMKKKQTIVKNVNAMESFGTMDVLCVDKTGTLTEDKLILEYYMDIFGNESQKVLDLAYLNSTFHFGMENHIDNAILKVNKMPGKADYYLELEKNYRKIKEVPFDYNSKISSVILKNIKEENQDFLLIAKGAPENILEKCSHIEYRGKKYNLSSDKIASAQEVLRDMLEDGMKILAIGVKNFSSMEEAKKAQGDELTLIGFIAFFDGPKKSAEEAIKSLKSLNVNIKVLTGDNKNTAISICRRLGINTRNVITGQELDRLSDNNIQYIVENTTVFAELTPKQKARIVALVKSNGHKVGFLGDGMNDLPAITEAHVGISVDTATPSLKEAADVILLKKDLGVLEEGILEGRRAFVNMTKYVKITGSSNLGNIFAIVIASLVLPFLPMTSIQLLLLNLLYDILCLALPWDNVDKELCTKPLDWSGKKLSGFMMFFGPISSIFDILTFLFLTFVLCPFMTGGQFQTLSILEQTKYISVFQTGWFLESMWTQILILHLLRSNNLIIFKSRPSKTLLAVTLTGILSFTLLVTTPIGQFFGFTKLPFFYFIFLIIIVVFYLLVMTLAKKIYIKHHHHLI